LIDVILLSRLPLLLTDEAITWKQGVIITVIQLLALTVFIPKYWLWGIAGALVLINVFSFFIESRAKEIYTKRLLVTLAYLLILSFLQSPTLSAQFRPILKTAVTKAADHYLLVAMFQKAWSQNALLLLFGLLLSLHEANLLIRYFIEKLQLRPKLSASDRTDLPTDVGEYNRGRVIGAFERSLVFYLVYNGQFATIGLIFTAKGLARFEELKNRDFAEYFLVGTLVSITLAGLLGLMIKWLSQF
jgi:hypothetical protein